MKITPIPCTKKQIDYLEILFADLTFDRDQRRAWLFDKFRKRFISDLTLPEAIKATEYLRALKYGEENL